MSLRVVPWSPDRHAAVLAFRRRMYPDNPHGSTEAHFRWRFLDNPEADPASYLLAVREEGGTEAIVGQWAGIPERLWAGGRAVRVAWMVDLVVDPAHRDTMAAAMLFRAAMRLPLPVLATGVNDAAIPFFRALRWKRRAVVDPFFAVFRPGPLLRLAGRAPSGARGAALRLADRLGPALAPAVLPRPALRVEELPAFGPETDALFARVRDAVPVVADHSAATLRWRVDAHPVRRPLVLAARGAGGDLRGTLVLKLRARRLDGEVVRWADVADLLAPPDDEAAARSLLAAALRRARRSGCAFVRYRASLPEHTTLLRPPLWRRHVRLPMDDVFAWDGHGDAARAGARALEAAPWYLTALSSDAVDTGLDEWIP